MRIVLNDLLGYPVGGAAREVPAKCLLHQRNRRGNVVVMTHTTHIRRTRPLPRRAWYNPRPANIRYSRGYGGSITVAAAHPSGRGEVIRVYERYSLSEAIRRFRAELARETYGW
jgi:hypothetical protein